MKEIEYLKKKITNFNFTLNELESTKNMLIHQLDKLKAASVDSTNNFNKEKQILKEKEISLNMQVFLN
jgi:hypothetical protein